jgi:hypothetical protein
MRSPTHYCVSIKAAWGMIWYPAHTPLSRLSLPSVAKIVRHYQSPSFPQPHSNPKSSGNARRFFFVSIDRSGSIRRQVRLARRKRFDRSYWSPGADVRKLCQLDDVFLSCGLAARFTSRVAGDANRRARCLSSRSRDPQQVLPCDVSEIEDGEPARLQPGERTASRAKGCKLYLMNVWSGVYV